jgi:hypothetical protein
MDTILTDNVWKQVAAESSLARRRLAAVAYVTSDRNLKLKRGDVLVCDASDTAIKAGQTSARLLQSLLRKGVELRSRDDLHTKAAVFGRFALIGSSNLSASSENSLTELALFTDRDQTVAQVTSFIHQLREDSEEIDDNFLRRILKLKVDQQNRGPQRKRKDIGFSAKPRTWIIGVKELPDESFPDEQKLVEKGMNRANSLLADSDSTISNVRWTGISRFRSSAREGDRVVQIWKSLSGKRITAISPCPIVLRQNGGSWTRFYVAEPENCKRLSWTEFERLGEKYGLAKVSLNGGREARPSEVPALDRLWS